MSINICVYCGSRIPGDSKFRTLAESLGSQIANRSWGLVYGGGKVGMMGVIADSVLAHNAEVIGIIPTALKRAEVVHTGVTEIIETPDMHTRKALMEKKSSAFIVLPGGFGTLDEFFEILTWRQLGIHNKPIILINAFGYFDGLSSFVETAIDHDFVRGDNRELFSIVSNVEEALVVLDAELKK
jgi:uncharacterized protein (TIGR00730 family)